MVFNIKAKVLDLDARMAVLEAVQMSLILNQSARPTQKDWEAAWITAGNALPIAHAQRLFWYDGDLLRGIYGTLPDLVIPLGMYGGERVVSALEAIGNPIIWETNNSLLVHRKISGKFGISLGNFADGDLLRGIFRIYLDLTEESLGLANLDDNDILLGYDATRNRIWYRENGTDEVQFIDADTDVVTNISGVVAMSSLIKEQRLQILPDGSAYFPISSANIHLYTEPTTPSATVITTYLDDAVAENAELVIAVTTNFVVVALRQQSANNLWGIFSRSTHLQTGFVKSRQTGSDTPNLPDVVWATAWNQMIADTDYANDTIDIVYANIFEDTGGSLPIDFADIERVLRFNLNTKTFQTINGLPYQKFYDAMRVIDRASDVAFRKDNWELDHIGTNIYRSKFNSYHQHNIGGSVITSQPYHKSPDGRRAYYVEKESILEAIITVRAYIVALDPNSTTDRIWRLNRWDFEREDVLILQELSIQGLNTFTVDITDRPEGYDRIEIIFQGATSATGVSVTITSDAGTPVNKVMNLVADTNELTTTLNSAVVAKLNAANTTGSILRMILFEPETLPAGIIETFNRTNAAGEEVVYENIYYRFNAPTTKITFTIVAGQTFNTNRCIVRAYRTESRRRGGSYHAHNLA